MYHYLNSNHAQGGLTWIPLAAGSSVRERSMMVVRVSTKMLHAVLMRVTMVVKMAWPCCPMPQRGRFWLVRVPMHLAMVHCWAP